MMCPLVERWSQGQMREGRKAETRVTCVQLRSQQNVCGPTCEVKLVFLFLIEV